MPYEKTLSKLRPTGRPCRSEGCDGVGVASTITRGAVGQVVDHEFCEDCLRQRRKLSVPYGRKGAEWKPKPVDVPPSGVEAGIHH